MIDYSTFSKDQLVEALRDPSTKGRRGSIVWQLYDQDFDCKDIVLDLTKCVLEGSFEEVNHSMGILTLADDKYKVLPRKDSSEYRDMISMIDDTALKEDWREEAIEILIDCLESP